VSKTPRHRTLPLPHARVFSPTESQRRALDGLWRKLRRCLTHRRLTTPENLQAFLEFSRQIEDTVIANDRGYDTPDAMHRT